MVENESLETPGRPADSQILLEEICGLVLDGACDASLRLFQQVRHLPADPHPAAALDLLRARILLRHGSREDRDAAALTLRRLCENDPAIAWRARLELARLLRRDGKSVEAASLLQQALEAFRASPVSAGPLGAPLSEILTGEAERLHESALRSDHAATSPAPQPATEAATELVLDSALLLRLIDLGRRLAAETDAGQVLRVLLHEAIDLAAAERGFVVLLEGERLEFAVAENLDWSEVSEPDFEVSRTLIREVGATRRSAFLGLADIPEGHPMSHSLSSRGVHAVACLPIVGAAGTLGVLYLDRRQASASFESDKRRLLDLFAGQAAAALENARAHERKTRELEAARELIERHRSEVDRRARYHTLTGISDAMQDVFRRLDLIVPTEMPVVILGETGTGKELTARLIHDRGPRRDEAFVALNCAGVAETLLESELFGHEKGAFTGADRARPGLFEVAHKGTLFLDEVGDMTGRMQGELLRVLQSGEVRRVGGREAFHVDVRVIAATHRDLAEKMRRGEFREDLYYRLNVLTLRLPPLRERPEDIPLLAVEILASLVGSETPPAISAQAMRLLAGYPWPGNVRELQNVLRRLTVLGVSTVEEDHLPEEIRRPGRRPPSPGTLRQAEAEAIRRAMEAAGGNKAEAARILGVDRKTLHLKLRRVGGS